LWSARRAQPRLHVSWCRRLRNDEDPPSA
jgi:hypothetical protein